MAQAISCNMVWAIAHALMGKNSSVSVCVCMVATAEVTFFTSSLFTDQVCVGSLSMVSMSNLDDV